MPVCRLHGVVSCSVSWWRSRRTESRLRRFGERLRPGETSPATQARNCAPSRRGDEGADAVAAIGHWPVLTGSDRAPSGTFYVGRPPATDAGTGYGACCRFRWPWAKLAPVVAIRPEADGSCIGLRPIRCGGRAVRRHSAHTSRLRVNPATEILVAARRAEPVLIAQPTRKRCLRRHQRRHAAELAAFVWACVIHPSPVQ